MTDEEKENIAQKERAIYSKLAYREYAYKYYPKKQAKLMIKEREDIHKNLF